MKKIFLTNIIIVAAFTLCAQEIKVDYSNPQEYILSGVTIKGTKYLDKNTLISISGLNIGDNISVPGDKISNSIRKLWKQGLFSDISVNISKIEGKEIYLEIHLKEHGKLSKFKFEGNIKKHEISSLKEELKLMRGNVLTENLINNSVYRIKGYFLDKGFNNIKVDYKVEDDEETINASNLHFIIDKGEKVKIKDRILPMQQDKKKNTQQGRVCQLFYHHKWHQGPGRSLLLQWRGIFLRSRLFDPFHTVTRGNEPPL